MTALHRPEWSLPALDAFNRDWFTSGRVAVQECSACGTLQHPPEEICAACGSTTFTSRTLAPTGTVYSYTIVHHAANGALAPAIPYAVVLVAVDDAPELRVVGNLLDAAVEDVAIGLPVEAVWDERSSDDGETIRLPQWRRRGGT
jgi:uncharacterized OB-fold protein